MPKKLKKRLTRKQKDRLNQLRSFKKTIGLKREEKAEYKELSKLFVSSGEAERLFVKSLKKVMSEIRRRVNEDPI